MKKSLSDLEQIISGNDLTPTTLGNEKITGHITNLKEKCLLCNFPVVFDHVFSSHIIKPENRFLLEKNSPLYERVYFQEFINYSNKSPPVLI